MMKDDLISRAAAKFQACNWSVHGNDIIYDGIKEAIKSLLDRVPAVDATPLIHGRWIDGSKYNDGTVCRKCSVCNDIQIQYKTYYPNYCPNCGAKNVEE